MDNENLLKIEEYKEVGHEYRYRDTLMVQEFSLAMVAIGIVLDRLWREPITYSYLIVQVIIGLFLFILAFHLDHINEDRVAALQRKEILRNDLKFGEIHKGVGGKRISAPRFMVWFAKMLIPIWVIWLIVSVVKFVKC